MSEGPQPQVSPSGSPPLGTDVRKASRSGSQVRLYGRNRYYLGFGALGLAALLIAVTSFLAMRSVSRAKDRVLRDYAHYAVNSQRACMLLEQQVATSRGYLLTGDTLYLGRWDRAREEVADLLDTLETKAHTEAERRLVEDIRLRDREYQAALSRFIATYPIRTEDQGVRNSFRLDLQSLQDSLDLSTAAFIRHDMAELKAAEDQAGRIAGLATAAVWVTTVFCLLLAVLLAMRVTRRLAQSQRTLLTSQARLDAVVSSAMDAIITIDSSQRIVLFNRAAERIFQVPVREALGQSLDLFIPDRNRQDPSRHLERFGKPGVASRSMGHLDTLYGLRQGGEEFPLEATLSQTEVGEEALYTVILRDITDRVRSEAALKESEAKLRQSQKMEAIGQLAGGIAHDFNNLLTAINGYSELTLSMVEKDSAVFENVKEIRKAGGRAATLTSQLLAYSRKQVVAPRILNLNQVVGNIGKLLQRLIGANLVLITRLEPELDLVRVDAGQVEQTLVNLVLNARDAMPKGGRIEIRTANVHVEPGQLGMALEAEPGEFVAVSVADTGTGMSPEVQARIFEPFYTTKPVGKGTGLGLPSVYGIMKQAGGALRVESAPGKGSTFSLFFPAVPADARPHADLEGVPGGAQRGSGETLLLAEDEPSVRHFTRKTLESHGYKVLSARDGEEALSLYQGAPQAVRLLVTDMVMPGLSGRELAASLRSLRPDLPVLFMSGYTEETLDISDLEARGDLFLIKPFSPDQLLRGVHDVLKGRSIAKHHSPGDHPEKEKAGLP